MNRFFLLLIFIALAVFNGQAQNQLTLEIHKLKNNRGKLLLEFMDKNAKVIHRFSEPIENHKCTIHIKNLKHGAFAFKFFHDENTDEKLNKNFVGMPKEGFGFSNNASAKFGPPAFEKTLFEFEKSDTIICVPIYL